MYTVIEMQTMNGVTTALAPVTKDTAEEARQEFWGKASYAAVSQVEIHTVMVVNAEGQNLEKPICCKHQQAAQAE